MSKKIVIVFVASIFLLSGIASIDAFAHGKKHKNPFKLIWQKLFDHEERIATLENQPSTSGIEVYDADDQFLGIFLGDMGSDSDIYIPSSNLFVTLSNRTGEVSGFYVYFESNDCTGTPYVHPEVTHRILRNDGKYYVGDQISPMSIQNNSRRSSGGTCIQSSIFAGDLVSAQEITLPFEAPVALPLSFE